MSHRPAHGLETVSIAQSFNSNEFQKEKMGDDERDDLNRKIINIGGTALLGTSFVTAAFVGLGRAAIAKRAANGEFGKDVDLKMMNEGSKLATKAFTRATIYTCGTFGSIIGTWCWYNNVWSIGDLRTKLRRFVHSSYLSWSKLTITLVIN